MNEVLRANWKSVVTASVNFFTKFSDFFSAVSDIFLRLESATYVGG